METKLLESSHNQVFKELLAVKEGKRKKEGLVLVEGKDLVEEAKRAKKLAAVISDSAQMLFPFQTRYLLSSKLYERLSVFKTPTHIMGLAKLDLTNDIGKRCVYLDGIQDPGNVGTLIRTALCFQYSSIMLSPDCASLSNPKTIQASKGAIFKIPVGYMTYEKLLETKAHLYLTVLDGEDESKIPSLEEPFALVLGNEGKGIPQNHQEVGTKIRIAMEGFDSLNVAVAGGIFMYRFRKILS